MTTLETLLQLLPEGWEEACFTCGAIKRKRKLRNPKDWMKLCLIYLMENCSMVQLSAIASMLEIADLSDVALLDRLGASKAWFEWIVTHLYGNPTLSYPKPEILSNYRILAVDGSTIMEKGAAPKEWHLHYALDIFTLATIQASITDGKTGESLRNYALSPNDLVLGDRAYGSKVSMKCCLEQGADFIFRMKYRAFDVYDETLKKIEVGSLLKKVKEGEVLELVGTVLQDRYTKQRVRILGRKLSKEEQENEHKRMKKEEQRRQKALSKEASAFHDAMVVVTSLPEEISAKEVFQIYQLRWQVELLFKRLKSIFGIGNIPNKRPERIQAWLAGKIMVALLLEKEIGELNCFP